MSQKGVAGHLNTEGSGIRSQFIEDSADKLCIYAILNISQANNTF